MSSQAKVALGRRQFFRVLGAGAAAGAVAPLVTEALVPEARADNESSAEKKKARYRESEEVKTYYRVNRYPSGR